MKGLKHKIFFRNNYALSGVIEALLLIGLVAIILSTIQLVYIPEIMKQKEYDHLDEVENQFAHLKSVIETQSMLGVIQSSEPISHSPISSPITQGNDKLPYFVTSQTLGDIKIIDKDKANSLDNKISYMPGLQGLDSAGYLNEIPLTSAIYRMHSMYIDYNPKYIFEGGGIILNQTGGKNDTGEVMRVNPAMTVENQSEAIKINYYVPVFDCIPGKNTTAYSIDTSYIRTNYISSEEPTSLNINDPVNHYIRIKSDHLDGWNNCLLDPDDGLLYKYKKYINIGYDNPSNPSYIEISPKPASEQPDPDNPKQIIVDFTIVDIGIQTGTGTVIS